MADSMQDATNSPGYDTLSNHSSTSGPLILSVSLPLLFICGICVALRIGWRHKSAKERSSPQESIAKTEWAILASLICLNIQEIFSCVGILRYGLGHHEAYNGAHNAEMAMICFYVYQIVYRILCCATKLSLIYLYMEIWVVEDGFVKVCKILNASIYLAGLAFVTGTIFQCTPVSHFWANNPGGTCIKIVVFWYFHSAWNVVTNLIIMLLPVKLMLRPQPTETLQRPRWKKFAIFWLFGLGIFSIAASITRMVAIAPSTRNAYKDSTFNVTRSNALLWTQVESSVAIICACLPTMRGPMNGIFPKLFPASALRRRSYILDDITPANRHGYQVTAPSGSSADILALGGVSAVKRTVTDDSWAGGGVEHSEGRALGLTAKNLERLDTPGSPYRPGRSSMQTPRLALPSPGLSHRFNNETQSEFDGIAQPKKAKQYTEEERRDAEGSDFSIEEEFRTKSFGKYYGRSAGGTPRLSTGPFGIRSSGSKRLSNGRARTPEVPSSTVPSPSIPSPTVPSLGIPSPTVPSPYIPSPTVPSSELETEGHEDAV